MAEVLITPQTATAAETAKRETPETTDSFHLVIDALKLNGLNTAPQLNSRAHTCIFFRRIAPRLHSFAACRRIRDTTHFFASHV